MRISDELWAAAQVVAKRNGETLSDVVRRALAEYAGVSQSDVPGVHGRADREDKS